MNQVLLQSMVTSHNFINFCSFLWTCFFVVVVVVGLVWLGFLRQGFFSVWSWVIWSSLSRAGWTWPHSSHYSSAPWVLGSQVYSTMPSLQLYYECFASMYLCTTYVSDVLRGQKKGIKSLRTRVGDSFEKPHESWELNLGPLQGQEVLSTNWAISPAPSSQGFKTSFSTTLHRPYTPPITQDLFLVYYIVV